MASDSINMPTVSLPASAESPSPHTSAVVDWVHQQSTRDPEKDTTIATETAHTTKLPPSIDPSRASGVNHVGDGLVPKRPRPARLIYDIATLLKLRETRFAVPVMLRVRPEAIAGERLPFYFPSLDQYTRANIAAAENIFQYMGANVPYRLPVRSRGLSDISNLARGNSSHNRNNTSRSGTLSNTYGHAIRQPLAPPQNAVLQRHDGFVRFLKQHASPPHHRVTAGGRIVPAGPSAPPPMLDFGSLNGIARDQPVVARTYQGNGDRNTALQGMQSLPADAALPCPIGQGFTAVTQPILANSMPMAMPYNSVTSGYQPIGSSMTQTAIATVPSAMFPDGSTLLSHNGINYRGYWNGVNMILEPMQTLPLIFGGQLHAANNDPSHSSGSVPDPLYAAQQTKSSLSLPTESKSTKELFAHQPANSSEEDLRLQLTTIDKYLALYHYEITPTERASYVTQRRFLIEEIDRIRVGKEKPKHVIPIVEPVTGAPVTFNSLNDPMLHVRSLLINGSRKASQRLSPPMSAVNSKGLSPAAPAFVPRTAQRDVSASSTMTASAQKLKFQPRIEVPEAQTRSHLPFSNLHEVTKAAISRKDKALHAYEQDARNNARRHTSSSSVPDPSDPAMRVIDYEDIEYAERYLYNWTEKTKTYCTTVAEFQEAVRRVREQARMYGCEGGQSKDPAYDAEQDIWWAICDRDPIPLPSKLPDHVSRPRPWNWNDSAFNYRRKGAPLPGPECDRARNSPRLCGWDPIITETMKDTVDVSRSYYALKGRLPSVPFRDFEYDKQGNKIRLESAISTDVSHVTSNSRSSTTTPPTEVGSKRTSNASKADTNALRDMSASEVNGRNPGPERTPKRISSRKMHRTDGDAKKLDSKSASFVPHENLVQAAIKPDTTMIGSTLTSAKRGPDAHTITTAKFSQPNRRSNQSGGDQYPETPTARRIRADSKGSPTLHSPGTSMAIATSKGTAVGWGDAQSDPNSTVRPDADSMASYMAETASKSKVDYDPWTGGHTDPISLDYIARLKTWCPGDPDVLHTIISEQAKVLEGDKVTALKHVPCESPFPAHDGPTDMTASRDGSCSLAKLAGLECSPVTHRYWNVDCISAETKSPCGPERVPSFLSSPQRSRETAPTTPQRGIEQYKIAKVNIPSATYKGVLLTGENAVAPSNLGGTGQNCLEVQEVDLVTANR